MHFTIRRVLDRSVEQSQRQKFDAGHIQANPKSYKAGSVPTIQLINDDTFDGLQLNAGCYRKYSAPFMLFTDPVPYRA